MKLLVGILCVWTGLDMIREAIQQEAMSADWRAFLRDHIEGGS